MIGLIVYLADIYTYVPNILSVERKKKRFHCPTNPIWNRKIKNTLYTPYFATEFFFFFSRQPTNHCTFVEVFNGPLKDM